VTQLVAASVLLLAAAPAVDWSHVQPMTVVMVDNMFEPDHLTFEHGTPYRLHLENRGKELHEFTAPEFLADAVVRDPNQLVQSGASVDVDLEPLKPGTYRLICADHDWDGMVGEIVVR
jgi:plastocyanin